MIRLSATIPFQHNTVYSPFAAAEFDAGLQWLADYGFDGVELCVTNPATIDVRGLKEKLAAFRMPVSTISTGQAVGLEGLTLTDANREIRQAAVNRLKDQITLAAQIACPQITVGLIRGVGASACPQDELDLLLDSLHACALYGSEHGVKLIIEPLNRAESTLLTNVSEVIDFLNRLHNPANMGVLLDTYHSAIEDKDIEAAIEKLGDKLFHVHFSDSNRGLPGTGTIDYAAVAAALVKNRFEGFVSLEVKNIPDKETVIQNGYQSMAKFIKKTAKEGV